MRSWLVSAVIVALLAAAGCGSHAGPASRGAADARQERPDQSLTRTEWQLTGVVGPSRTWRAVGGFVDRPRNGSVVIAFGRDGRELGRSHRLAF